MALAGWFEQYGHRSVIVVVVIHAEHARGKGVVHQTLEQKPLVWQFDAVESGIEKWCECGSGRRTVFFVEWKRRRTREAVPVGIKGCTACKAVEIGFCQRSYASLRRALREKLVVSNGGHAVGEDQLLDALEELIEAGSNMWRK